MESAAEKAEEAGKRGDARTILYKITRKLSGRFKNTCKPVRNEAGVLLRSAEEEMHQWREHFQTVLNHEDPLNSPEVEPNDELNIRTGRITRIETKNAIKKLKRRKAAGCDKHRHAKRVRVIFLVIGVFVELFIVMVRLSFFGLRCTARRKLEIYNL